MRPEMKNGLRQLILFMVGGASLAFALSGCVTEYEVQSGRNHSQPPAPVVGQNTSDDDGNPAAPPVAVEPPMVAEPAAAIPVFPQPPPMAWDSRFGMYFVVGTPIDLFFYGGNYYVFSNGGWYRSLYYNGPWLHTEPVGLPPVFHSHRVEELHRYREGMNRDYAMRPDAYSGRMFDHREDHHRDHYDRKFMDSHREQMQRDREFYAQHPSPGDKVGPEHHEPLARRTDPAHHEPPAGNHDASAVKTVPVSHDPSAKGSLPPGQNKAKKPAKKPLAQKTALKKLAPKKPTGNPDEKKTDDKK